MRRFLPTIFLLICLSSLPVVPAYANVIHVIRAEGIINPVSSEFITTSIVKAEQVEAEALIIEMDTPGGLDPSMREIIKTIIASEVPIVVYVAPSGGRAASAGVFITLSAHLAAMAPGTNIGAAHPVVMGARGSEDIDEVMQEKMENDAAAYVRSLAEQRGRNADWAEAAVLDSDSITENEALEMNVIDLVAKDLPDLIAQMDGRIVTTLRGEKILATKEADIVHIPTSLRFRLLQVISDPNVAYVLMLLGTTGLIAELYAPGTIFPGVSGTICLILAFFAFQTLPINYAGLLLIFLGLALFIAEMMAPSFGILGIGGTTSLLIGSLLLIDSDLPSHQISLQVIIPSVATAACLFLLILRAAVRSQKEPMTTGVGQLIGEIGVAQKALAPEGPIQIQGEIWQAESDTPIAAGEKAKIVAVEGLKLRVKKIERS